MRPRPRPKFWPRGQFGLEALTSLLNYLLKYADDASLLCPQNSSTSIELEMAHVITWARENEKRVNPLKTVELIELVFRRPNISNDLLPCLFVCSPATGFPLELGINQSINHFISGKNP